MNRPWRADSSKAKSSRRARRTGARSEGKEGAASKTPARGAEENRQLACKPGSVWPRLPKETERGSHSSGTALARSLVQPTRMTRLETGWALARPCHPYSVLLPVGFTVPSMLPCPRWALTPPFHPYSASGAVCFLWHFPWGHPRRTLSGTVSPWSPDFPHPAAFRRLQGAAARPTGRGSLTDRGTKRQKNRRSRLGAAVRYRYATAKSVSYSSA
ncbi:hypothetical protein M728_002053 [Ensifer sp. WSM1721]